MRSVILAGLLCLMSVEAGAQQSLPLSAFEGPALSEGEMKAAVNYIESHVVMPEQAEPKAAYGRYYAQEKGIVYGFYARLRPGHKWKPGVHIVADYAKFPGVMDGGCSFIDIIYLPSKQALAADCHGL
ncbi:hypothetical protein [Asticcacaulis sp. AND118]|uniref:hypothetical protein n=1 Tax=Asticcacaulis sp. AND118 TaxID=2840468 RepID=UPI001CFFA01B|nr:hypothetical protein [Asticcacaulis sp. AND118]UDF04564.1 hypothetical protein LH365_05870 [Asticcacaulis sp. AND118]